MNIYFLMHDALFHFQRGSSHDIPPYGRERVRETLLTFGSPKTPVENLALIMMLNMALNTLMQNLRNMIVEQEISLLKFQGANVT